MNANKREFESASNAALMLIYKPQESSALSNQVFYAINEDVLTPPQELKKTFAFISGQINLRAQIFILTSHIITA